MSESEKTEIKEDIEDEDIEDVDHRYLYARSAMLTINSSRGTGIKMVIDYCSANSKAEAVGLFTNYLLKEFPGYSIAQILTIEIKRDDITRFLRLNTDLSSTEKK